MQRLERPKDNRRDFLKKGMAAGLTVSLSSLINCSNTLSLPAGEANLRFAVPAIDPVKIGFVGIGGMGSVHVQNLLNIDGVQIKAVCDIVQSKVEKAQQWVVEAGQAKPTGYSRGERDFVRMCETEDLDLVYTATPWEWHVPVCVAAMKNGKHAATEVPAAITLDECWELVENSEKFKKHCLMMENCCYDRPELMVFNMVRKGLFGEVIHAEAGYCHDLRALKFSTEGEGLWRTAYSIKRNANLYPTHGLGPVAQCMDINRGDRFDFLVSMSSVSRGLNLFAAEKFGPDSPQAKQKYTLGDINTTMIQTKNGKTITLVHDTDSPRPYSRINMVQGTKAIFQGYPDRIYLEGKSPSDDWEPLDNYAQENEHPLWKSLNQKGEGRGHGGMDFIEDYRLIQCLRTGSPTDFTVYDAADWSVIIALSEKSVANKSRPVDFPDFTRGHWKTNPPLGIMTA
jgi:hypothetical protein